jgi:preprotein translocase subunit SecD
MQGGGADRGEAPRDGDRRPADRRQQGFDQRPTSRSSTSASTAPAPPLRPVTQENVGKPFAIILDNVVLSAPNINEPILGGSGADFRQLHGRERQRARRPAALGQAAGRAEGDRGAHRRARARRDSIRSASSPASSAPRRPHLHALTYGRFGVYADIALILNVVIILGIMAIFNATLTLPGIAGFVLTIGAAVDANVIINERIREEQRRGRKVLDAIEHGYNEARPRSSTPTSPT